MARDLDAPFIKTISGYVNVANSLELDPPLACRRWFAHVADGAFCLYNTERARLSSEAPLFNLVLDNVSISVETHVQMLQLTYMTEKGNEITGISFQVIIFTASSGTAARDISLFAARGQAVGRVDGGRGRAGFHASRTRAPQHVAAGGGCCKWRLGRELSFEGSEHWIVPRPVPPSF